MYNDITNKVVGLVTVKMTRLKNFVEILLVIEGFFALFLYVFVSNNFLLFLIYVWIKNLIVFGFIIYATSIHSENNLSVSEALNDEAKNAFIFGGIGLIQYDENRNITWISDLFIELQLNIVGKKLLEWQPLLASLFEDDDIKVIDINSRKY